MNGINIQDVSQYIAQANQMNNLIASAKAQALARNQYINTLSASQYSPTIGIPREVLNLVAKYNNNPKKFKAKDAFAIEQLAKKYGLSTAGAKIRGKATTGEKALAFGAGMLDSMLFGVLKNSWYENRYTKNWGKAGRIGGLIASLFLPSGLGGLTTKGATKTLEVIKKARPERLPEMFGELAKSGVNVKKALVNIVKKDTGEYATNAVKRMLIKNIKKASSNEIPKIVNKIAENKINLFDRDIIMKELAKVVKPSLMRQAYSSVTLPGLLGRAKLAYSNGALEGLRNMGLFEKLAPIVPIGVGATLGTNTVLGAFRDNDEYNMLP